MTQVIKVSRKWYHVNAMYLSGGEKNLVRKYFCHTWIDDRFLLEHETRDKFVLLLCWLCQCVINMGPKLATVS